MFIALRPLWSRGLGRFYLSGAAYSESVKPGPQKVFAGLFSAKSFWGGLIGLRKKYAGIRRWGSALFPHRLIKRFGFLVSSAVFLALGALKKLKLKVLFITALGIEACGQDFKTPHGFYVRGFKGLMLARKPAPFARSFFCAKGNAQSIKPLGSMPWRQIA